MYRHLLLLLIMLGFQLGQLTAATDKPNIVIFLSDDQSQLDCTPYGRTGIRTPSMQRLADAGMTFSRAYVASPGCAPSHAALLTGLMPARNGAESNHGCLNNES